MMLKTWVRLETEASGEGAGAPGALWGTLL